MLKLVTITKSFGARTLFSEVSMSMVRGERLGLCGRNGSGKSTLFKIILGIEQPDDGSVVMPRGYRIGHLAQHLHFTESTVLAEACLGLPLEQRHEEYRAEIILSGLGFSESDFHKAPAVFSGGFQIRINLAKLLLSEPDLLLLDEPTNYLDIVSIRWLEDFLREWRGELVVISHDRAFMDAVTTHTALIHRQALVKVQGNTEKLYTQVSTDEEVYEKTRVNEEKKRKQVEVFISRFRAQASKAAMVQSRVKALERMGTKEELQEEAELDFEFRSVDHPGKVVVDLKEVTFGYDPDKILIKNLNLQVRKGDRIAIIGKNGKGKSTLLRLIAGEISPLSGEVAHSPNMALGYFGQTNIARLDPACSVEEEVLNANGNLSRTQAGAICGAMMFSGDAKAKKVRVLSGGEKARVLLAKILARPSNLLLLDEPSNHLDMESIEALIESLSNYDGAVVLVTHGESMLRAIAKRLVVFRDEVPQVVEHEYQYFLDTIGWGEEAGMSSSGGGTQKSGAKDEKGGQSTGVGSSSKERLQRQFEKKLAKVEADIAALEEKLQATEQQIALQCEQNKMEGMQELVALVPQLKAQIDQKWEEYANVMASSVSA